MMRIPVIFVALAALIGGPADAQTNSGPRALAPGVQVELNGSDNKATVGAIDETALRHYARIGDVQRMEAEIARLKAIDPNWQPPKDLFSPPPASASVDDSPIWALVSGGKLAEARAAVAEQRRKTPTWEPSAALLKELDTAEAAERIRAASNAKRWQEATAVATSVPAVLDCAHLDTMWRVAQAYGEMKDSTKAFDLYKNIVTTCPKVKERRDTLFKAKAYLSAEQLRDLVGLARANPGTGEDAGILDRALNDLEAGSLLDTLGGKNANPSPQDLERATTSVVQSQDAGGAVVLGWYFYNRKDYAAALEWFQRANEWKPGEDTVEGLVYTNTALKQPDAARAAGDPWRDKSPRVAKALALAEKGRGRPPVALTSPGAASRRTGTSPAVAGHATVNGAAAPAGALDAALAAHDWARCLSLVDGEIRAGSENAGLLQQKGWCLLEVGRPAEAGAAFAAAKPLVARATDKDRAKLSEVCDYGLMISRIRRDEVESVLRELDGSGLTADHQRDIRVAAWGQLALRAYEEKRYLDTLRFLDARRELAPEPRGLTLMRGWSLYNSNRRGEALSVLEALDRRLSDDETRAALATVGGKNGATK